MLVASGRSVLIEQEATDQLGHKDFKIYKRKRTVTSFVASRLGKISLFMSLEFYNYGYYLIEL